MSEKMRLVRALMHHLETKLTQLVGENRTVNPADPTSLTTWDGFVSFMYDPWSSFAENQEFGGVPPCQTYSIHVDEMWGMRIVLCRRGTHRVHTELYIDDHDPSSIQEDDIVWLERLLQGDFGRTVEEAETLPGDNIRLMDIYDEYWSDR